MSNGVELFNDEYCGWHTVDVKSETLKQVGIKNRHYEFYDINDVYGFRAYRECPIKK